MQPGASAQPSRRAWTLFRCCAVLLLCASALAPGRLARAAAAARVPFSTMTLPVADTPLYMALDRASGRLLVLSEGPLTRNGYSLGAGALTQFDAASGRRLASQAVPGAPIALLVASSAHQAYVAGTDQSDLTALDSTSGRTLAPIPLDSQGAVLALAVDAGAGRGLVLSQFEPGLGLATFGIRSHTLVPGARLPGALEAPLVVDSSSHLAYFVTSTSPTGPDMPPYFLHTVDTLQGRPRASAPVTRLNYLAVDAGAGRLIGLGQQPSPTSQPDGAPTNQLSVFDTRTHRLIHRQTLGARIFCLGPPPCIAQPIAVDQAAGRTVVLSEAPDDSGGESTAPGTATVIDTRTGLVVHTVPVGYHPIAVAVDSPLHRAYVANNDGCSVTVFDTRSGAVQATVLVGLFPVAIEVDTARQRVFVANEGSATISVFDAATTVQDTRGCAGLPPLPTPQPVAGPPEPIGDHLVDLAPTAHFPPPGLLQPNKPGYFHGQEIPQGIQLSSHLPRLLLSLITSSTTVDNELLPGYATLRGTIYQDDTNGPVAPGQIQISGSDADTTSTAIQPIGTHVLTTLPMLPRSGKLSFTVNVKGSSFVTFAWRSPHAREVVDIVGELVPIAQ